jgi:hypothetical protein
LPKYLEAQHSTAWQRFALRGAVLFGALFFLSGCAFRESTPIECRLSPRAIELAPGFVLSSKAHYAQRDARWAQERIGGSGKPLKAVGCTVCCVSMALAQHGIDCTPAELNRALQQVDGYTSKGWVRWAAISQVTHGQVRAEILRRATHRQIDEELAAGNPLLVKVAPPSIVQHWVLLVGRAGREFLMKDPLDPKATTKPLSTLGSEILAVRVIKKNTRERPPSPDGNDAIDAINGGRISRVSRTSEPAHASARIPSSDLHANKTNKGTEN